MTQHEKAQFREICNTERSLSQSQSGIGTYNEKLLHRIIKRFVYANEGNYEIPIGGYVADLIVGDRIFEIQTSSLRPLADKLRYYLEHTDLNVTVIHPIIANKTLIRMDKESGEIIRARRSPLRGKICNALPELFYIRELFSDPRLSVCILLIDAEEHRYSERMRYRKAGAYDSILFPTDLIDIGRLSSTDDLKSFLPSSPSFSAKEYSQYIGIKGRDVYSALNFLCYVGVLKKEKEGNKYIYHNENF